MLIIAIDFDGTIAHPAWPDIGEPIPGAFKSIQELYEVGHTLILYTCREETKLFEAVSWLHEHNIKQYFDLINANEPDRTILFGGDSRKISADLYIDDKAIGCPKDNNGVISWKTIMSQILKMNVV